MKKFNLSEKIKRNTYLGEYEVVIKWQDVKEFIRLLITNEDEIVVGLDGAFSVPVKRILKLAGEKLK